MTLHMSDSAWGFIVTQVILALARIKVVQRSSTKESDEYKDATAVEYCRLAATIKLVYGPFGEAMRSGRLSHSLDRLKASTQFVDSFEGYVFRLAEETFVSGNERIQAAAKIVVEDLGKLCSVVCAQPFMQVGAQVDRPSEFGNPNPWVKEAFEYLKSNALSTWKDTTDNPTFHDDGELCVCKLAVELTVAFYTGADAAPRTVH